MKVALPLCAFLMLFAQATLAQQPDAGSAPDTLKVRGCLRRSRQNYIVVDHRGFAYALKGVGTKLDADVGREVEVTGVLTNDVKTGIRSEKAGSNPSDTVRAVDGPTLQILNVSGDVHKVADKCTSR